MRPGHHIGREEPPGLGPRIAEGMPHAAWDPNERAGMRFDPLLPIEEGEGPLQDVVRFLLQVMDMRRRPASGGIVLTKSVKPSRSPSALSFEVLRPLVKILDVEI